MGSGGGGGGGYGLQLSPKNLAAGLHLRYLTGILDSSLLDFAIKSQSSRFQHGWYAYNQQYIQDVAVVIPRLDVASGRKIHAQVMDLAEQARAASCGLVGAVGEREREKWLRALEAAETTLDEAVFELYDATPDERALAASYRPAPASEDGHAPEQTEFDA
ncbi:MAG: hypothetical protein EXR72_01585 [Myxococcales bacterium]|nr:hypothetical protein [Myxococcales bacterium]